MPELTTRARDKLQSSQFAYVDSDGGEHLPIHDESHIRNAMARFNQTEFESIAAKERARASYPPWTYAGCAGDCPDRIAAACSRLTCCASNPFSPWICS